jgi:pimeloyl-ACP methyl ester carboxylesterase
VILLVASLVPVSSTARAGPTAEALFRKPSLLQVVVSPSGEFLAAVVMRRGWQHVLIRRREESRSVEALKRLTGIGGLAWLNDENLLVPVGPTGYRIVTVSNRDSPPSVRERKVHVRGRLVSTPSPAGEVLWSLGVGAETVVYRLPLASLLVQRGSTLVEGGAIRRVASRPGSVVAWVADHAGIVRAGLQMGSSSRPWVLWYRGSSQADWRVLVEEHEEEDVPVPLSMADDGRDLIVAARGDGDTRALHELSAETGALGRLLFADPDADVAGVALDPESGKVIGARFERAGLPEVEYFDSYYDRYQRSLEHAFPRVVSRIADVSRDLRYFVVLTVSARHSGTYYLLDTQENVATWIGRTMPWLDPEELAEARALRVTVEKGHEVDAFLTLPTGTSGDAPLVVLPHGGPMGVRDLRLFDPLVQFLAGGGLAVLQVNYRGSAGRGKAFLDAGKRQWGKGIEDDLEAAVDEVVRTGWVDTERMCVVGGSYGGYSALMSVIRSPERYRCAASLNGPTDLQFLYHSWFGNWKSGREFFEESIGDPEDSKKLQAISPAYLASGIRVPILLVQGTEDPRVDVDHFYRMQAVLEALGKPFESYLMRGTGHGLTRSEWIDYASRLRAFLVRHLEPR